MNNLLKILKNGINKIDNNKLEKINLAAGKELSQEQLKSLLREGFLLYFYNIRKTIILFLLAIVGSIFFNKYMLVIILIEYILTSIIGKYAGGIHLNKTICFYYSFTTYFLGYLYSININLSFVFRLLIFITCIVIMSFYAPRSIKGLEVIKENYMPRKFKSITIITLLFIISCFVNLNVFKNLIIWVIFMQSINITPIVYKIFCIKEK